MNKKIKVLTWSDGPTVTTGFARVTREVLKSIYSTGKYEITSIGINYHGITPEKPDEQSSQSDIDIYDAYSNYCLVPAGIGKDGDPFGRNLLLDTLEKNDFDILWILQDSFNVVPLVNSIIKLKKQKKFKVIFYFPIDTYAIHDYFLESTKIADAIVVYNDWSNNLVRKMRGKEVGDRLHTIYHAYDPKDFFAIPEKEKKAIRKSFFDGKIDDKDILIMRSDSNQQRKDWFRTLRIVANVAKENPKVKFYANTTINNPDFPIFEMATRAGLTAGINFFYQSQFTKVNNLSQKALNELYNIADIGITTTKGEGCGLFHYEMMAIGKPVLVADNSSHTEAVDASAAIPIYCGRQEDESYDEEFLDILPNDLGVMRPLCSIEDGTEQLKKLIANEDNIIETTTKKALEFMKDKTWKNVGEEWIKLFDQISSKPQPFIFGETDGPKTVKDLVIEKSDNLMKEYSKMIQTSINDARKKWIEKYHFEPPKISYIGKEDESPQKKNNIVIP